MTNKNENEKKPLVVKNDKLTLLTSIPEIFKMLKASFSKEYPNFPTFTFFGIILVAAYLFFPIDIIPDTLPFIGIVDDATVLAFFVFLAQNDLEKFQAWKNAVSKTEAKADVIDKVEVVDEDKEKETEEK
jgi:uncharacterized membrane protein YkvA (DUF1232 family)